MAVKSKKKVNNRLVAMIAAAIAVSIIISAVIISVNSKRTQVNFLDTDKHTASGIDVSEHNGKIDWKTVSKEVDFAFIRVGYCGYSTGEINEDKQAKRNLKEAAKVGVPVGVYFYTQAINKEEAEKEAQFVLDFIKGYSVTLPVFIDFEYALDSDGNMAGRLFKAALSKKESTDIINAFCGKVSGSGYACGVYASSSVLAEKMNAKHIQKDAVIWVADYNKAVTYDVDYDIWQYTKTGSCKGVKSKFTDLNTWYLKD